MKTACVFAHFDPQDKVDDYVLYYLRELKRVADSIQFVTTSELCAAERRKVEELGVNFMQRKNEGYDFYSFKLGIEAIGVSRFDQLIVCNDSVYGPLSDLATVLAEMRSRNAKFWGLTNSHDYQHHLQSYFLVFAGDALQSQAFKNFWGSVQILDNKVEIIRRYEVGLSQSMAAAGFPPEALAEFLDDLVVGEGLAQHITSSCTFDTRATNNFGSMASMFSPESGWWERT